MIELNFRTTDLEEIALAQRYWAMTESGKFQEEVADLLPFRDISTTTQLVILVRKIAQARDCNQICPNCGGFEKVTSRSHARKNPHVMNHNCNSCQDEIDAQKQAEAEQIKKRLAEHLQAAIRRSASTTVDYDALPDDVILLLLALNRAISPRLLNGTFMRGDCRALAPAYVSDFVRKLYKADAIVDRPEMAKAGAYFVKDDSLWHYADQVVYRLTPDKNSDEREVAFSRLEQRTLRDHQAIRNLWLDFATADCMCYFFSRCELHGLTTVETDDQDIYSKLHAALRRYSVSQLWSVIWKIVEDAAALSTRDYYTKPKAAATLPGKLLRHLEKIEKGQTNFGQKKWDRPTLQPAGTLGQIFSELYNIDETTLGSDVMVLFSIPVPNLGDVLVDPSSEELAELALNLMSAAIGHYSASEVLLCFADSIRAGANVRDAIEEVFERHPYLADPY